MSEREISARFLNLVKIDAKNLFNRIKFRKPEYLEIFALQRSRSHFDWVFETRYSLASLKELTLLSLETIHAADEFYTQVDDIRWYLFCTQDMPNTISDKLDSWLKLLEKKLENLNLYIEAQIEVLQEK